MKEVMYDQNSALIAVVLFLAMSLAIEVGYRIGLLKQTTVNESGKAQINSIQSSLLGLLALLLGFSLSLALQRYDTRSAAVVDEANAIGTAVLRAELLPISVRSNAKKLLQQYLDLRIQAGAVTLVNETERQNLVNKASQGQRDLWRCARQAAEEDGRPVSAGLFIQSINDLIDSFGRRDAGLNRHVPEVVLFLLFGTFLMTGSIMGYATGIAGHRPSRVTYIMVGLLVLIVFMIIDLDRPRRGLVEVNQKGLTDLKEFIGAEADSDATNLKPADTASPAGENNR